MTMLDIQGVEDFHGDMDFKVGSTLTAEARQFLERYEAYRDACVQTSRELYSAFFPGQR